MLVVTCCVVCSVGAAQREVFLVDLSCVVVKNKRVLCIMHVDLRRIPEVAVRRPAGSPPCIHLGALVKKRC